MCIIRPIPPLFTENFVLVSDDGEARSSQASGNFHFRELGDKRSCKRSRRNTPVEFVIGPQSPYSSPVNPVRFFMVAVITQFISDEKSDQDKADNPYTQPHHIYEVICSMFRYISKCDLDDVLKHDHSPIDRIFDEWGKRNEYLRPKPKFCSELSPFFPELTEELFDIPDDRRLLFRLHNPVEKPLGQFRRSSSLFSHPRT